MVIDLRLMWLGRNEDITESAVTRHPLKGDLSMELKTQILHAIVLEAELAPAKPTSHNIEMT
jgi:hypothetical protein